MSSPYDTITDMKNRIKELELQVKELENDGQVQWETHQMCQALNLTKIRSLELQVKELEEYKWMYEDLTQ